MNLSIHLPPSVVPLLLSVDWHGWMFLTVLWQQQTYWAAVDSTCLSITVSLGHSSLQQPMILTSIKLYRGAFNVDGQNLLAFPDFTSCLLQKQGVAQLLRSPGVYGLLSILSWLPFAFLHYVLPPSVPCINVLTPQWMFISYIWVGLDSHQERTKLGSAWRWTETPDDGALKFISLVLIKIWMRVHTRAHEPYL